MSDQDRPGDEEQAQEQAIEPTGPEPAEAAGPRPAPGPRGRRARDPAVARAFRAGRPVSGKIVGVIKGGYEVRIGRSRAFCPHSQVEMHRVSDPEEMIGREMTFKVTQYRRGGEDVVVSHRALLEEERNEEAKALRAALLEGAVVRGRVAGVADFGAFVDLGAGVMGLVHISELSHRRVEKVEDAVAVGDSLDVKILKLHRQGKISLSARQAEPDPWQDVAEEFAPGKICRGTVQRLADFGAFVELRPGIEALAPAREFPPSREGWRHGLEPGTEADWLVLSVSPEKRRVSITPAPEGGEAAALPELEPGAVFGGKVQKVERYGVFVWLGPGRVGLMPGIWSGEGRGTDLSKRFPIGSDIEVEIVEVADEGRRLRLARKGHAPEEPREPRSQGQERAASPGNDDSVEPSSFGTSLGDALRAALRGRQG